MHTDLRADIGPRDYQHAKKELETKAKQTK
jgi:hypothetical protein